ncbi:MAG: HD family hydrolase [Hyphomicrobiales bacterium]|nr:HD family hydrolase [Hyphomicrobiales bacterium]
MRERARKAAPRSAAAPPSARAWQRMLSGRRLDLLDPSPLDVELEDIAHGLARVARWNGQTIGDYSFSVAEHSLLVEKLACALSPELEPRWRLAALLHDAPEYVIGDLISPFKAAVGLDYRAFEGRLLQIIHVRFGLPGLLPGPIAALIKRADKAAAYAEATQLAGFSEAEAAKYFGRPRGLNAPGGLPRLKPIPAAEAERRYRRRIEALQRA